MGAGCGTSGAPTVEPYNVHSTKLLDHYSLGETLGRGAFGVVKAATLKPEALRALQKEEDCDPSSSSSVARRRRFAQQPLAVKVMRQEKSMTEGDSSERLEAQVLKLEKQVEDLESTAVATNSMSQFEELQWLKEYSVNLRDKLDEKRKNQTKKTPREMMLREVSLLEKCDHRFIMQLVETFEDTNLFCVVFERCYGTVVSRYPQGVLNVGIVARQSYQLLSAVDYLHAHLILHRDIKPENLMFRTAREDAEVLLGDFGMAVELRKMEDRCQGCAGTPHFVPPEGFHSYYQSFPSDVWACGCTTYWMLFGQCPFEVTDNEIEKRNKKRAGGGAVAKSIQTTAIFNLLRSTRMGQVLGGWKPQFEHDQTAILARKICHPHDQPSFTFPSGQRLGSDAVIDLLLVMLKKDPRERITTHAALQHPWILGVKHEAEQQGRGWTAPEPKPSDKVRMDKIVPY
eukprot:TRINITY_DN39504_c0_g1_i1.p1 TRINITY_DN39504_c0_g1~~TRINITY_DN39504_c0_g1_i1.p1  ORF type:complete len:457 (-),score=87.79 TRINITY_DN39504_c0_g1_i1:207-1577(-)